MGDVVPLATVGKALGITVGASDDELEDVLVGLPDGVPLGVKVDGERVGTVVGL